MMMTDFQTIAEPLIRDTFPDVSPIKRTDECRGVVHLDFTAHSSTIRLSWEPYGPPWAQITYSHGDREQIRTAALQTDNILVSQDMKTEVETKELLNAIKQRLEPKAEPAG